MIDENKEIFKNNKTILNRRFKKLTHLIDEGEYFSEESIRMREPLLYFLYVGQYKRHAQQKAKESSFSEFLTEQAMKYDYQEVLEKSYNQLPFVHDYPRLDTNKPISEEQLEDNEDELIRFLHDKFLQGQDQFNYQDIDNNAEFDDQEILERDEEEKYFDDQEEDIIMKEQSVYNNVQDY